MGGYFQRIGSFPPDIKRFLIYNLLANIGFGVTELMFNLYLVELGYREDYIGEWRAVQTISMAVMAVMVGSIINRWGAWRSILVGFSSLILSSIALAMTEQKYALLLIAIWYGISLAFLFNPLMPFILEYARPEERQQVSAVSFSIVSLSMMIGSLVGGFGPEVIHLFRPDTPQDSIAAYRGTLIIGSLIAAIGLVPLLRMEVPRLWHRHMVEHRTADVQETPAERKRVKMDMAVFIAVGGMMALGVGMVQPFYNVYLTTLGASDQQVGFIFALGGLCSAVIGLGAPWVANRFGSLRAILWLRLIIVPFYLALVLSPTLGLAVLALISRQISINMAWPIDSTFIGELLPPRARSGVYGMRSGAWNLGIAISSFVAGRIIVERGYDLTFVAICFFTALAAFTYYIYFSRHPKVVGGEMPGALGPKQRLNVQALPTEP